MEVKDRQFLKIWHTVNLEEKQQALSRMYLKEIAAIVVDDWSEQGLDITKGSISYAVGWVRAMSTLNELKDNFYAESGVGVVAYFLCNAKTWKGETARAVKKELNKRLKGVRRAN